MSVEAFSWALTVPIGGNQKVVLLGIANHAHPDGTESYPTLDTLAVYAACDRSTARRNVRRLIEDGWVIEDGLGPKGQAKYRLPIGVAICHPSQSATGGASAAEGVASEPQGGGIAVQPEPSFNRPENRPGSNGAGARDADELWEHYLAERKQAKPRSTGCKRGPVENRLVRNALLVRSLEDCKAAVTALFKSDFHVQRGLIGIKYALLGGGRSPDPATTIDRLTNGNGHANGNGNGRAVGILERQIWPDGRSWAQHSRAEQLNIIDEMAMGNKTPWLEREVVPHSNGDGNGQGWTADNICDGLE